jgi:hypothetical protein
MTIRIKKDRIEFDNFTLKETAQGFTFDGTITAAITSDRGYQGNQAGYITGGYMYPGVTGNIEKYSFTTTLYQNSVGNLAGNIYGSAGSSSPTHGFNAGGVVGGTIEKFPFAVDANATTVGSMVTSGGLGVASSSTINGYCGAGYPPAPSGLAFNKIERFPFSTNANATSVGTLATGRQNIAGISSAFSGYAAGGRTNPPSASPTNLTTALIEKFSFNADSNATSVGQLTLSRSCHGGISGPNHGYAAGGYGFNPSAYNIDVIDKFAYSSDVSATAVGVLAQGMNRGYGHSSMTEGYSVGNYPNNPATLAQTIQKFPFATDSNSSNIGNGLITYRNTGGSQQV